MTASNLVIPEKNNDTEGFEMPIDTHADGLAAAGFFPQNATSNDMAAGIERDSSGNLLLKDAADGSRTLASIVHNNHIYFKPGTASGGDHVATWAEVKAYIDATTGIFTVFVDSSGADAHVNVSTDCKNLVEFRPVSVTASDTLIIDDGHYLKDIRTMDGYIDIVSTTVTGPTLAQTSGYITHLVNGARFLLLPTSVVPMMTISGGQTGGFHVRNGQIATQEPGVPFFVQGSFSGLSITGLEGSTFSEELTSGSGTFNFSHDAKTLLPAFTGHSYIDTVLDDSALVKYNNSRFDPMLPPTDPNIGDPIDDVQDAIDALKRWPYSWVQNEIVVTSVSGQLAYTIPVGNIFLDAPTETELAIDTAGGTNYVPQLYGIDYTHLARSTAPATVIDAVIGFVLGSSPPNGWTMRFRWKERRHAHSPPPIAKVKTNLDYSVQWNANSPADHPNGVVVPAMTGFCVEFWRESHASGGKRGSTTLKRNGRRYVPFYRGSQDVWMFNIDDFSPTGQSKRQKFRVCYYDPTTGARSALSNDKIIVCSGSRADQHGGDGQGAYRQARSVWIE